jgi:hypothetical protein
MPAHPEESTAPVDAEPLAETLTQREDEVWAEILKQFREACLAFHEGHEDDARLIATTVLPPMIREWSSLCEASTEAKKDLLLDMFCQESRKITDLGMLQRLIVTRLSERVLPTYAGQLKGATKAPAGIAEMTETAVGLPQRPGNKGVSPTNQEATRLVLQKAARRNPALQRKMAASSRKVPITDIAGMVDSLNAAEFADEASEMVPLRELFDL